MKFGYEIDQLLSEYPFKELIETGRLSEKDVEIVKIKLDTLLDNVYDNGHSEGYSDGYYLGERDAHDRLLW